jgi:hypothetical protein
MPGPGLIASRPLADVQAMGGMTLGLRAVARLAVAAAAVAVAMYLVPASAHIVAWPATGPERIALLPPLPRLWWSLAATLAITSGIAAIWLRRGRALDRLASAASPLTILLLWALPFLPWLPDRAPLLLALAGPLRWIVAGVAVGGTLVPLFARPERDHYLLIARSGVFAISLVLYVSLGLQFASDVGFSGDEPHYLVIAHSLLVDHDLDIGNNHARRDYRAFFLGDLRPDYLRRGIHGEIYSIHAPGLPAIVLPAYAAAGASGAVVTIATLAALTALAIFDLALLLAGRASATLAWAAVCLTVPFVPHAWLIYPEMAAALIAAWSALWLWSMPSPSTQGRMLLAGSVLAILPWLHTKFVVLMVLLAVLLAARARPRVKRAAVLLAPIAVSTALWLYSFYRMYGVFDPEVPYAGSTRLDVLLENIPRGVLGLLLDQKFGLMVYSPVYALAAAGAWFMLRERKTRLFTLGLAVTVFAFLASTTRYYMWWGGSSAPARFLVPIVPLLAPLVAVAIDRLSGVMGRSLVGTTVLLSIGIAVASVASPRERFLFSNPHGVSELVRALQGSAPLDAVLPTFTAQNWHAPVITLVPWLAALAVAGGIVQVLARKAIVLSAFWMSVNAILLFGLTGSILTGLQPIPDRSSVVARGRHSLLEEYDSSRLSAVDCHRMASLGDGDVLTAMTVSGPTLNAPFDLPAGRYEARVWFTEHAAPVEAFATLSEQVVLGRSLGQIVNPLRIPFQVFLDSPVSFRLGDPAAAAALERVEIVPLSVVPPSARSTLTVRTAEPLGDRRQSWQNNPAKQQSYVAYTDDNTYPEGGVYWTRDTRKGTVAIVPEGASELILLLHVGRNGARIAVEVDAHREEVDLAADETREMRMPIPPGRPWLRVAVQASRWFRPSDADSRSDDRRRLGCQVRPLLE